MDAYRFFLKFNSRVILFGCFFIFFLVHGGKRLFIATQTKIFNELEKITESDIQIFHLNIFITIGSILILSNLLLSVFEYKKTTKFWNSFLSFLIVFMFYIFSTVFSSGLVNSYLNIIASFLTENKNIEYLINGIILILISLFFLHKTIRSYNNIVI